MLSIIFAAAVLLMVAAFVGVGVLVGRKYAWQYAVAKAAVVAIAIPVAIGLSCLTAFLCGTVLKSVLTNVSLLGRVSDLFKSTPMLGEALRAVIAAILAPILFYVFFPTAKTVLGRIAKKLSKKLLLPMAEKKEEAGAEECSSESSEQETPMLEAQECEPAEEGVLEESVTEEEAPVAAKKLSRKEKKRQRDAVLYAQGSNPWGMVAGGVSGLLLCIAFSAPVVGTLNLADRSVDTLAAMSRAKVIATLDTVTDALGENIGVKVLRVAGGDLICSGLTTYRVGEARVNIADETEFLFAAGEAYGNVVNQKVARAEAAASVRAAADAFDQTELLPTIAPEVLSEAGKTWKKDKRFLGIAPPSLGGEKMKPVTDQILSLAETSTSATLRADIRTLAELVATMVEKGSWTQLTKDPTAMLSNEELTAELLLPLLKNERTKSMVGDLMQYGVTMTGDSLGVKTDREGLHAAFAEDMARMIEAEKGKADGTAALLRGYAELFDNYGLNVAENFLPALAEKTMAVFQNRNATADSVKAFFAETPLTMTDGAQLQIADEMSFNENSILLTLKDLKFDSEKVPAEHAETEALALAHAIVEVMELKNGIDETGFRVTDAVRDMGDILDALVATETAGKENTNELLTVLLQSKKVTEEIGFTLSEANAVSASIAKSAETQPYSQLMGTLSDMIKLIQMSSSNEDISDHMDSLLAALTTESANVLQTLSKPSVLTRHGVPDGGAETGSQILSSMFGNLAEAKESGMSDDLYKKESKAASDMTNMIMKNDANTMFGENGALGISADEYVNNVMDSQVVSGVMVDSVYQNGSDTPTMDPLNSGRTMSAQEQVELLGALNTRWNSADEAQKADPEYQKTYVAIGAMYNMQVNVGAAGVTLA